MEGRMTEDTRKQYWDDNYYSYWQARVAEAGQAGDSGVVGGDAKTEDDSVYEFVFNQYPLNSGNVLDVGCAWGRMFPLFKNMGLTISGVDISAAMVNAAKENWQHDGCVHSLEETSAEVLPYPDGMFDNLVCVATFDATYQHVALAEMMRVVRPGGRIYITGKHYRYHLDDLKALAAEKGARGKNHPNYFTDVAKMLDQLYSQGEKLIGAYYFSRRGDFASFEYVTELPNEFYEYFLVFERGRQRVVCTDFSSDYSKTFLASEDLRNPL